ncbi:hypothetical protein ABPG72_010066 [Tetrahymena utriculariae]
MAFGSMITLILVSAVSVYSFYILNLCFQYSNPNILSQDYIVQQPNEVVFDQNQYTIAMGIQDQNLVHFLDESIYYQEVQLLETTKTYNQTTNAYDQKTVVESIQMEHCTLNHFQVNQTKDYFNSVKFNNIQCFPLNLKMNLQVSLELCYIKDNIFKLKAVKLIAKIKQKNTIRRDQGLISQSFQDDYRMIYINDRETLITKTDNKLYEIYIWLEKNKQLEQRRTYLRLLNAISQIGGIYYVFFLLGSLICYPIQRISLYYQLINSLLDFKENRGEIRFQFLSNRIRISGDDQTQSEKEVQFIQQNSPPQNYLIN